MKRVLIAGGQCGTTMLRAAERIREVCRTKDVDVKVDIINLWDSTYVKPGYDLVIEMFPFFGEMECPLISGKPFINRRMEKELLHEIMTVLN